MIIARLMAVVVVLTAAVAGMVVLPALATFPTSAIADNAETHADLTYGGQCKAFVGNVVMAVIGTYPAGYQQGFASAGAVEVTNPANALRGDIIQITPAGSTDATAVSMYNPNVSSAKLHTAIIRAPRNGDGTYNVIDSNWSTTNDGLVRRHTFNPYSWAGGSIIKIWRFGTASLPPPAVYQSFAGDFNGDGQADIGLRNKSTGMFFLRYGPTFGAQDVVQWDNSVATYQAFAGDFNGDNQADVGLRDPLSGWFYLRYGPTFLAQTAFQWDNSVASYQAFAGDFNGDNQADVALRNPSSGWFYIRYGPDFTGQTAFQWDNSVANYQAFVNDFNSDGHADVGLRNPSSGWFYLRYGPAFNAQAAFQWDNSVATYQSFAGDINGDGLADVGLRNPSSGWFYLRYGPTFVSQTAHQWDIG